MTEAEFLKLVIMKCDDNGLTWWHDYNSKRNPAGLPDLTICGTHHLIWRELKLIGESPQKEQVTWKYRLLGAGQDYAVWTPRDLSSGRIDEELISLNVVR